MRGEGRQDTRSKCCGCKLAAALSRALARLSPHTTHADPAFSPSTASGTARGWLRWFAAHTEQRLCADGRRRSARPQPLAPPRLAPPRVASQPATEVAAWPEEVDGGAGGAERAAEGQPRPSIRDFLRGRSMLIRCVGVLLFRVFLPSHRMHPGICVLCAFGEALGESENHESLFCDGAFWLVAALVLCAQRRPIVGFCFAFEWDGPLSWHDFASLQWHIVMT